MYEKEIGKDEVLILNVEKDHLIKKILVLYG